MKYLFIGFLFVVSFFSSAQKENDNWYFGYQAGINFSSGAPVILNDGVIEAVEGCASISDKDGNLLFYTNGINVWNAAHQTMDSGTNLFGHTSCTQAVIIVPHPGDEDLYYIFTNDIPLGIGLSYSIIDITASGGLGAVIQKNVFLLDSTTERLTAVRHANGRDVWIITQKYISNSFYAYLLTAQGLKTTPVINNVGIINDANNFQGYLKASHNGKKMAIAFMRTNQFGNGNIQLMDFDNECGILSNPITLADSMPEIYYGVEFSPDNLKLYVSYSGTPNIAGETGIAQFDLNAGPDKNDLVASRYDISLSTAPDLWNVYAIQLAPDDKIYVSLQASSKMSVINNPNQKGAACAFQNGAISLSGSGRLGLPPIALGRTGLGGATEGNNDSLMVCLGDSITFYLNDRAVSYTWTLDEIVLQTSNNQWPYIYLEPGSYNLIVYLAYDTNSCTTGNDVDTIKKQIVINECDLNPFVPNSFSPNGDGINDVFHIDMGNYSDYIFEVYNLSGQKMASFKNGPIYWDGKANGIDQSSGVYIYRLEYTLLLHTSNSKKRNVNGNVILIR